MLKGANQVSKQKSVFIDLGWLAPAGPLSWTAARSSGLLPVNKTNTEEKRDLCE